MRPAQMGSALSVAVMLSGCITAYPRPYTPVIEPPPADAAVFERDFATCRSQVAADLSLFNRTGGGDEGWGAPTDTISSAVAIGQLAWALANQPHNARATRTQAERDIQAAMTNCLQHHGHSVVGWELLEGGAAASSRLQTPTRSDERTRLLLEAQAYEANAESDPKWRAYNLEMAAKARRKAERFPPPAEPPRWWYRPGQGPAAAESAKPEN